MSPKHLILFILILSIGLSSYGQKKRVESRIDEEFPTQYAFPKEYYGKYFGNLRVANGEGVISNTPMEFYLSPTDTEGVYNYKLIFIHQKQKETKSYTIKTINLEKGAYLITDDNSDLSFPATLVDNILFSTFQVDNNILNSELIFKNNGKVYLKITSSTKFQPEDSNKAPAYFVSLVQKATFAIQTKD